MSSDENKSSVERQNYFPLVSFTEDVCIRLVSDSILSLIILPFPVTRYVTWQALVLCICLFLFLFFPELQGLCCIFHTMMQLMSKWGFLTVNCFFTNSTQILSLFQIPEKSKILVKMCVLQVFQQVLKLCITDILEIQCQQSLTGADLVLIFFLLHRHASSSQNYELLNYS